MVGTSDNETTSCDLCETRSTNSQEEAVQPQDIERAPDDNK